MPPAAAIALVVLNHGRPDDTLACARSILGQQPFLLVIVDNASPDDSVGMLAEFGQKTGSFEQFEAGSVDGARKAAAGLSQRPLVLLVKSPVNGGYAAGNNLGIAAALELGADACWVLNNDTLLQPGAIKAAQNALQERRDAGIGLYGTTVLCGSSGAVQCLGGGSTNYWSGLSSQTGNGLDAAEAARIPRQEVEKSLNYICGASVIATRPFLEQTGLMDERFFLYCEEQDWALRGQKLGFALGFIPEASIIHFEGSTTGMRPGSRPLSRMARLAFSRLRLAAKHAPITIPGVTVGLVYGLLRIYCRRLRKWADGFGKSSF